MRGFLDRVLAMAHKELLHIARDRQILFMGIGMPAVLLVLFGYGIRYDLDEVPTAVVDQDRSRTSRALVASFAASNDFRIVDRSTDPRRIETLFRRSKVLVGVVIPPSFERDLRSGRGATVQLLVDGTDDNTARLSLATAEASLNQASLEIGTASLNQASLEIGTASLNQASLETGTASLNQASLEIGPETPMRAIVPLAVATYTRFNPTGRSTLFLVPGLTVVILTLVSVLLTSLTVAKEWEQGTMRQLFATPVGRLDLVLGKLLPYLALAGVAELLALTLGAWIFGVPLRGSIPALVLLSILFMVGMLGQGLLISVVARTQMVASQAGAMTSTMPAVFLSGFTFPIENMPTALQWVSRFVPARYFVTALRGILLRGNDLSELSGEALALSTYAALVILLCALFFRRRIA